MTEQRTFGLMTCAYCGQRKPYPVAFPYRFEARCWQCFWQHHQEGHHSKRKRWWRQ